MANNDNLVDLETLLETCEEVEAPEGIDISSVETNIDRYETFVDLDDEEVQAARRRWRLNADDWD